jgi:hypothetical protein
MKRIIMFVLFGFCGITLACSGKKDKVMQNPSSLQKVIHEYLLAHGFKQSVDPDTHDLYELENVHLADVARDLNFPLSSLRQVPSRPPDLDERSVEVGMYIIIQSELRKVPESGEVSMGGYHSLDDPNAICMARVWLNYVPPKPHLETDSTPRLNIKSIKVTEDSSKPLQITFEISADGTLPVAIRKLDFYLIINRKGESGHLNPEIIFPEGTPDYITVKPNNPITLTAYLPGDYLPEKKFKEGEYIIQIALDAGKPSEQYIDYQWDHRIISNHFISNNYNVTIK